ncbi:hypothetical protein K3495_g10208 [Podosphaera aphanis]|nr:hypothetical protein K3495_g10208 [Podosphaera aphanis]
MADEKISDLNNLDLNNIIKELCEKIETVSNQVQSLCESKVILEQQLRVTQNQLQQLIEKYEIRDGRNPTNTLSNKQNLRETTSSRVITVKAPPAENNIQAVTTQVPAEEKESLSCVSCVAKTKEQLTQCIPSVDSRPRNFSCTDNPTDCTHRLADENFPVAQEGIRSQKCPFSNFNTQTKPEVKSKKNHIRINVEPREKSEKGSLIQSPFDPISAALCGNKSPLSAPASTKCPIRFLNQHSPEEIAQYLETHKHEIPRSHAICVKRQQKNEKHVRNLDAKYGSLANIIQGLGQKHKPLLPEKKDSPENGSVSSQRLQTWAQNLSTDEIEHEDEHEARENDHNREPRSDRQLKEVRVGESPSRPWGISVPVFNNLDDKKLEAPSPIHESGELDTGLASIRTLRQNLFVETTPPQNPPAPDQTKCNHLDPEQDRPFTNHEQHTAKFSFLRTSNPTERSVFNIPLSEAQAQPNFLQTPNVTTSEGNRQPQMIFTGPVLIGYSVDEAVAFTKQA